MSLQVQEQYDIGAVPIPQSKGLKTALDVTQICYQHAPIYTYVCVCYVYVCQVHTYTHVQ